MRLRHLGALGLALAAFVSTPATTAQEAGVAGTTDEPIGRIERRDQGSVLVSQGTRVDVEVLVPTYFMGAVQFPDEIEIDGAVVPSQQRSTSNLNERIGGTRWAGVRRTYFVYPTRPGDIVIEGITVTVIYARDDGSPSGPTPVEIEPVTLSAYVPDGTRTLPQFFASESFELNAADEPSDLTVRVGETLTRTFTMTARNTPGLFLPRLQFDDVDGASVYPGEPALSESGGQRGSARTAERVEAVTYTFEAEGEFHVPGVTVNWWDIEAARMRRAEARAITVTVLPNPDLDATMTESDPTAMPTEPEGRAWVAFLRNWWRHLVIGLIAIVLAARLLPALVHRTGVPLREHRDTRAASEERAFEELLRTARRGQAIEVYAALTHWLDRHAPAGVTLTLREFAAASTDPQLRAEIESLEAAAFGEGDAGWSAARLVQRVAATRRRGQPRTANPALPPLNPA